MKALIPGSFDPFTLGHLDLVRRARKFCSEIVVVVAQNPHKSSWLTLEQKIHVIRQATVDINEVIVTHWDGPISELARNLDAQLIIKGLRNEQDLQFEAPMAHYNQILYPACETIYLPCKTEWMYLSSSAVRQLFTLGQNLTPYLHPSSCVLIEQYFKK